jgi:hypothetical protein
VKVKVSRCEDDDIQHTSNEVLRADENVGDWVNVGIPHEGTVAFGFEMCHYTEKRPGSK